MKVRIDYVSNSSSASFIVPGHEATKMFHEDFKEHYNNESMSETMRVQVREKGLDQYDWGFLDLDEFVDKIESGEKKWDDIEYIYFNCDDWDSTGLMYLNFLYKYFEKFGFKPDDTNSEREFREGKCGESFLTRILDRLNAPIKEGDTTNENS